MNTDILCIIELRVTGAFSWHLEEKGNLMASGKFTAFTAAYLDFREKYPLVEFLD
jgi:hypothetical protein